MSRLPLIYLPLTMVAAGCAFDPMAYVAPKDRALVEFADRLAVPVRARPIPVDELIAKARGERSNSMVLRYEPGRIELDPKAQARLAQFPGEPTIVLGPATGDRQVEGAILALKRARDLMRIAPNAKMRFDPTADPDRALVSSGS